MVTPLSALLSQVLVALTIEIDNTYESRAPHHTTEQPGDGPWLVSYAFWANLLRLVPDDGVSVRELSALAGAERVPHPSLAGMTRWGYVWVGPDGAHLRPKDPRPDWIVQPTPVGRTCRAICAAVPDEVEVRWAERIGDGAVGSLRDTARSIVEARGLVLPGYLPHLRPRMFSAVARSDRVIPGPPTLVTMLSNVLHAFAIDAENGLPIGLAALANPLRVLDEAGVAERELPARTGIAKEANRWATGSLERAGWLKSEPDPATGRGRALRLTPSGVALRGRYEWAVTATEAAWETQFGSSVGALRAVLEHLVEGDGVDSLRAATQPPEACWRARVRQTGTLPHFPFVWHRGGYPDGA